jgi:O-antigen/teichoic acid export membrane protein
MLGIYALAVNLIQTPANFVINTLSQTLLPALSHVQDEPEARQPDSH